MSDKNILHVSDDSFEDEILKSQIPVLVDFWAAWCGPCRALTPVLEAEVERREGAVVLAKVDVDANPGLSAMFRVQGIPAVKAFRDGRVASEFVGARGAAAVSAFVDELLAPPRIHAVMDELRASRELPGVLAALENEDPQQALDLILDAIPDSSPEQRERLRDLAVAVFEHLGHEDPVTVAYRRRLASALY